MKIGHLTELHIACLHCAVTEGHPGPALAELLRLTEASSVDGILAAVLVATGSDRERLLELIRRAVAEYRVMCDETAHACM